MSRIFSVSSCKQHVKQRGCPSTSLTRQFTHSASMTRLKLKHRGGPSWTPCSCSLDTVSMENAILPLGDIDVEFKGQKNGRLTVQGMMRLPASGDMVYRVLSDFDKAPDIFTNVQTSSCKIQDEIMVVKQTCSWRFLFFTGSFNLELEVIELVAGQELVFKLRESSFMKDFEGRWHVQRLVDNTCLVTHTLSVMPTMVPPEAFAEYTSKIFIRQVRDILQDLQQGVIRRVDGGALS